MKRTTVSLPDDMAGIVEREARRRNTSVSDIVRAALATHFKLNQPRELPFAALGHSAYTNTAQAAEEILAREWADDIYRDAFNRRSLIPGRSMRPSTQTTQITTAAEQSSSALISSLSFLP